MNLLPDPHCATRYLNSKHATTQRMKAWRNNFHLYKNISHSSRKNFLEIEEMMDEGVHLLPWIKLEVCMGFRWEISYEFYGCIKYWGFWRNLMKAKVLHSFLLCQKMSSPNMVPGRQLDFYLKCRFSSRAQDFMNQQLCWVEPLRWVVLTAVWKSPSLSTALAFELPVQQICVCGHVRRVEGQDWRVFGRQGKLGMS